jgi:hypothetical protein
VEVEEGLRMKFLFPPPGEMPLIKIYIVVDRIFSYKRSCVKIKRLPFFDEARTA